MLKWYHGSQCKKIKYLLDARVVLDYWVVDDSKGVLDGGNVAFSVKNENEFKQRQRQRHGQQRLHSKI